MVRKRLARPQLGPHRVVPCRGAGTRAQSTPRGQQEDEGRPAVLNAPLRGGNAVRQVVDSLEADADVCLDDTARSPGGNAPPAARHTAGGTVAAGKPMETRGQPFFSPREVLAQRGGGFRRAGFGCFRTSTNRMSRNCTISAFEFFGQFRPSLPWRERGRLCSCKAIAGEAGFAFPRAHSIRPRPRDPGEE